MELWHLCLTNQLKALQMYASIWAKLKCAAPKVSQAVFLWELKTYIYISEKNIASPPPLQSWGHFFAYGKRGGRGSPGIQCWGAALLHSSLHASLAWNRIYCSPLENSFWHLISLSWGSWGINTLRERALAIFFKLFNSGKDWVYNWEALEDPMGAGLRRPRNFPKLKQI